MTADTVAANVKQLRAHRGLTQADLSQRLTEIGRPIPVASIGKLETGLRKIEVDDLVVLAIALDVSPLTLLLPGSRRATDAVAATGVTTNAGRLWEWGLGVRSLEEGPTSDEFTSWSLPWWLHVDAEVPSSLLHPLSREQIESEHADG
jgi:transcriptional regulator with XRE-family HTH domain